MLIDEGVGEAKVGLRGIDVTAAASLGGQEIVHWRQSQRHTEL